jgi:adenine deaminase
MQIKANLVDILQQKIYAAQITVQNQRITAIEPINEQVTTYILPGFIDAHVHVESSMLIPTEFARLSVVHGTVATVSDPHEIGNVLGIKGVEYMLDNAAKTPFKICFGAPSCVPATDFETAGATITPAEIEILLQKPQIGYLSEMMNYPGVLYNDPIVHQKIAIAKRLNKPIDGHAPGLMGEQARQYISAGISTDHECFTEAEALNKLNYGMKILVREGSAAKNFEALAPLLHQHWQMMMFCSDDKHPDDLIHGHINLLVKRALAKGVDLFKVLNVACLNAITHYKLDVGRLQLGDWADFIVVDNLSDFNVLETYINGQLVAQNGQTLLPLVAEIPINHFNISHKQPSDFALKATHTHIRVIEAIDGEIVTKASTAAACIVDGYAVSDVPNDILKITVVNRYQNAPPAVAFIKNFGLQCGAIASTVAHDSHNIIAVGVDDQSICQAVNLLVDAQGGVAAFDGQTGLVLPLPVAGLMTNIDGYQAAHLYAAIDAMAKQMGAKLKAPYMSLSFMALLVIPSLKLSDKGLFDGTRFAFEDLFVNA